MFGIQLIESTDRSCTSDILHAPTCERCLEQVSGECYNFEEYLIEYLLHYDREGQ